MIESVLSGAVGLFSPTPDRGVQVIATLLRFLIPEIVRGGSRRTLRMTILVFIGRLRIAKEIGTCCRGANVVGLCL